MGKEDVSVVEHPPSPYSTLPSVPSFVPSHMERAMYYYWKWQLGESGGLARLLTYVLVVTMLRIHSFISSLMIN